jgi:ribonuclease H / adenosylcobalamin/alpha-ribazole phosphatase
LSVPDVVVYADGGSRGNPGPAGYGAVVFGPDGAVLAERAAYLGRVSNNVAEYSGLIAGLEAASDLGARRVAVRMDSKLVVEQMSGRWQVKHPDMRPLARAAAGLVARFDRVTFDWVPRAQNSHADRLANEAMDAGMAGGQWVAPPVEPVPGESGGLFAATEVTDVKAPGSSDTQEDPAAALPDPHRTTATRLLVIRHGETTWGAAGKFAGREDVPLTARGRRQASSAAHRLRRLAPVAVLTSPLQRCRLTAEAIAGAVGAEVIVTDELIDGTLGEWTGFTPAEIEAGWPVEFAAWRSDPDATPPGGESFTAIRDRVRPLLADVAHRYRGHTVVLVTHAAPAKMILAWALDAPSDVAYRIRIDTASLTGISVEDDGTTMVWAVNETGHLPD